MKIHETTSHIFVNNCWRRGAPITRGGSRDRSMEWRMVLIAWCRVMNDAMGDRWRMDEHWWGFPPKEFKRSQLLPRPPSSKKTAVGRPTATIQYLISFEAWLNPKNICRLQTYRKMVCAQCAYLAAESEFGGQYPVVLDPIWSLALLIRSSTTDLWPRLSLGRLFAKFFSGVGRS